MGTGRAGGRQGLDTLHASVPLPWRQEETVQVLLNLPLLRPCFPADTLSLWRDTARLGGNCLFEINCLLRAEPWKDDMPLLTGKILTILSVTSWHVAQG